jgi:NAD(P)-dependent dehydrogenase (short-subunit alcohol dehydrogenase family)
LLPAGKAISFRLEELEEKNMGVLDGKAVVVTGAGRGIGRAVALAAAAEGAGVVIADPGVRLDGAEPSSAVAEEVLAEITSAGGRAIAVAESVTTMAAGRRIVQACVDGFGLVSGVVCCAGILRHGPFTEMSEDDFSAVIDVHLKGHFNLFRAVVERPEGGTTASLVAISSGYILGDPIRANYRAAKAGIVALMQSVALAGESVGFRCNGIAPVANTRMTQASQLLVDGDPEDIAPMAVYLLSDASSELNGRLFSVRGEHVSSWRDPDERRAIRTHGRWTQEDLARQVPWLYAESGSSGVSGDPVGGWLGLHER